MDQQLVNSWIITRRSVRKYNGRIITDENIKEIIKAGMYAPSAANCQPWHFIITSSKDQFAKIKDIHPHASFIMEASHAILVCGDENMQHAKNYYLPDCGAATQNLLLSAHGLGIGSCWVGIYPRAERMEKFKALFRLPANIQPFALVTLGYSNVNKEVPERFKPERIHIDHWGN